MKPLGLRFKIFLLLLFTIFVSLLSLSLGSVNISLSDTFNALIGGKVNALTSQILFQIRLPRILLALAVGGGLSVAGAVFQSILMNPLAEPYILGISSGGTFGAVLSFLLGLSFWATQIFAFAGAAIVVFLVFILSKRYGELEPNVLLLTGIMIGAFFAAATLFMLTMLQENLKNAVFWLMGNLTLASADSVIYVLPITIIVSLFLVFNGQKYNVLSLGDESARHLGINTSFLKNMTYVLTSIMIGAIVSVSGIVGFVGLLIPHLCRLIFGFDNRIIIPVSFFIGASYLIIADTIARILIAPAEFPVGTITALVGAPIFIYLMKKRSTAVS
jgi:iron complex transport system permease protein